MTRSFLRSAAVRRAATALITISLAACGSSSDGDNPDLPIVDVDVDSQLVDVGQRYHLDASNSFDPESNGLDFFWTLIPPEGSSTEFDDHCEDDPEQVCTRNFDACANDPNQICNTNSDCDEGNVCVENFAESSPDCTTGTCAVGEGRDQAEATFLADLAGPYTVRVLVESSAANNTGTVELDTYPSLFVLGSLFSFGGTLGGLIGESADAETFSAGAVAMVANPTTGNLLLAIPGPPPRVREYDFRSGSDLGQFGETADFVVSPVAMAIDNSDRILIANADGSVGIFDGEGRFIDTLGDVTAGTEQVSAIAVLPTVAGDLLVVDGRAGQPIRRYDASSGAFEGAFGTVEGVAIQAVDVTFFGDSATVFVADRQGQLVRCTNAGLGCAVVPPASLWLATNGPTSIATNPAADATDADILIGDSVARAVIGCKSDGTACSIFGETAGLDSAYLDVAFAPAEVPEPEPPPDITTTTTTTTVP